MIMPQFHDPMVVIRMRAFDRDGKDVTSNVQSATRIEIFDFNTKQTLQELVIKD